MGNAFSISHNKIASVIRTLIYYDIFKYPLLADEIFYRSALKPDQESVCHSILEDLVKQNVIYKIDDYYLLEYKPEWIQSRIKGEKKAGKWMKKAHRYSKLIYGFPYVRAIAVSGSLSKGILNDDPDIDYFIITAADRLWISRTLLVLFKKIFLFNSYKYFCINYFIDSSHLEIEEKNLFTATELTTMIPMFGNGMKVKFFQSNQWVGSYYPNFKTSATTNQKDSSKSLLKGFMEWILNNRLGNWLDTYLMKLTNRHRERRFGNGYSETDYQLVFKATKGISKHHPNNFQKKVAKEFEQRKKIFEQEYNVDLKEAVFKH